MTRVAVVGNAAGGKSTLARKLSRARSLPYHAVDRLLWQPGWMPTPAARFAATHEAIIRGKHWIVDGLGPDAAIERRFAAADTIIFVDHPLWLHYWWATKRQVASAIWGREDGPECCPMAPVTFRLYVMMWRVHRQVRPRLIRWLETHCATKTVFHIKSPGALAAFAQRYCATR